MGRDAETAGAEGAQVCAGLRIPGREWVPPGPLHVKQNPTAGPFLRVCVHVLGEGLPRTDSRLG